MDISNAIIKIRESKGIKQIEIAQKLGIEQSNYSRLEKRGNKMTLEQLQAIAQALGVSVWDIQTWGESRSRSLNEEALLREVETLRQRNNTLEEENKEVIALRAENIEVKQLKEELNRARSVLDAFVYMLNAGKGMDKGREKEILETFETDLDQVFRDSAERMEKKSNE